ncbi:ABC transporter ATP-binding protein [Arhodomonas aquaeolei]|uniref:ABC transporter ATP-binding protein n=1 Tax=Arhodomonas aquaeolei TaxID=2369 RepID=UPI000371C43F|nr:ABC transporter ATP-binding protein [Arhodomonas aquaeolei]
MNETVLSIAGLTAGYGSGDILQGASLEVRRGDVVGVLGRNGVGKTTLMRTVMGLTPSSAGSITHNGADVTGLDAEERAVRGFGYVPQGRMVFPHMSVEDNLRIGALERGRNWRRLEDMYQRFPRLRERRRQRAGTLSGGEQEMLVIARALVGDPDILLLDEPSEGVQPNIVKDIGALINELNQTGITVLLVEQNVELMQAAARVGYVMEKGRITQALSEADMHDGERLRHVLSL